LILIKIRKTVAIRFQILRLKCTKFDFGLGSAQNQLRECSPDILVGFKGPMSKGREGQEGRRVEARKGMERGEMMQL